MIRVIGLAGLVCAFLCSLGFVAAVSRADARLRARDVVGTSRLRGVAAAWGVSAVALVLASVVWLTLVVFA